MCTNVSTNADRYRDYNINLGRETFAAHRREFCLRYGVVPGCWAKNPWEFDRDVLLDGASAATKDALFM